MSFRENDFSETEGERAARIGSPNIGFSRNGTPLKGCESFTKQY